MLNWLFISFYLYTLTIIHEIIPCAILVLFSFFSLFDQYVALEKELKSTIEESRLVQEKYHGLLDQARKELATKHAECDQIRKQVKLALEFKL